MNYIDFHIGGIDAHFLTLKLFSATHSFMRHLVLTKPGFKNLAVDFPNWTESDSEREHADIGSVMRVFGTMEDLEMLTSQPSIALFKKQREISFTSPKSVPTTTSFVRLTRDRSIEKNAPYYQQKHQEKVKAKHASNPDELMKYAKSSVIKKSNYDKRNTYFFKLSSHSTNQERFSLLITREKASGVATDFSSYGLSAQKDLGVPNF